MKGMSLLSQVAPEIKEEQQASESDCHVPAIVVSPCKQNFSLKPTAPLALSRWADLQRLADEELLKSKSTWQDTMKSIEAVAGTYNCPPSLHTAHSSHAYHRLQPSKDRNRASSDAEELHRLASAIERDLPRDASHAQGKLPCRTSR